MWGGGGGVCQKPVKKKEAQESCISQWVVGLKRTGPGEKRRIYKKKKPLTP